MKNKNEEATIWAKDCGLNEKLTKTLTMQNLNTTTNKFQFNLNAFVCDECARPLHLYGENFIDSYTKGKANILRCLCNMHAEEFGFGGVSA